MKKKQSIFYLATMISGMLSVASCNNAEEVDSIGKQVPLEIQVGGVQATRSIIEGNKLPEECQYGIFAMEGSSGDAALADGVNARVDYIKGTSTLSQNIYLPNGVNSTIYAYYPFNKGYDNTDFLIGAMRLEIDSQTDYLYGYSADNENRLTHVNANQPKAKIYFKHALARVTMRIKKSADNENTYEFPYINLLNVDKNAYINILEGGAILDPSGTANLTAKPSEHALGSSDNEIVADFLVIPGSTEGKKIMLNMSDNISSFENGLSAAVPVTNWEAGQQYTYTVTIKKNNLEISQAEITPWENNEQGGIEVGDDNYAGAFIGDIYYSDNTYSSELNPNKTPIGIVFALTDEKDGDINRTLTNSKHGRIVALKDTDSGNAIWSSNKENVTGIMDYDERGEGTRALNAYGQIVEWPATGAYSDFDGQKHTQYINTEAYPAGYSCYTYKTSGREVGSWYLPACGELFLIAELCRMNIISNSKQNCFENLKIEKADNGTYPIYWSSTEIDDSRVHSIISSTIYDYEHTMSSNYENKSSFLGYKIYSTRAVTTF